MTTSTTTPVYRKRRVLIVEDSTYVVVGIRSQLEKAGYDVVGVAANSADAERIYNDQNPNVVLMDIRLGNGDSTDGIELATRLMKIRRCPMVILSAFGDQELVERANAAGVFGYLVKPVGPQSVAPQIEVSIQRFEEHEKALAEKNELLKALETRKLVERAKGIFMKRFALDEPEAHRRLQLESQKRRMSLADLAKRIIESADLLGE
jgi:response regulator NasT